MVWHPLRRIDNLTSSKEDILTEFFAIALKVDEFVRNQFYKLALDPYFQQRNWGNDKIDDVETQKNFPNEQTGKSSCVDMIIKTARGKTILCENKIDADQTIDIDGELQLEKYLKLPCDALMFIRANESEDISSQVLENSKYIRPRFGLDISEQQYFLWRNFYEMLGASRNQWTIWLSEYFDEKGFCGPSIGFTLPRPDDPNKIQNESEFQKHWSELKNMAKNLGWKTVYPGDRVEVYINGHERAPDVWISPRNLPLLKLHIAFVNNEDAINEVVACWRSQHEAINAISQSEKINTKSGPKLELNIRSKAFIGDEVEPSDVGVRLVEFFRPLLERLSYI